MTNLHTIIGRLNQKLIINQTRFAKVAFPKKIGNYSLDKILKFRTSLSGYAFAEYRNSKKIALAKAYFGKNKNHLYYGLRNEINTYKLLTKNNLKPTKINNKYYDIPKIINVVNEETKLIALLEKVDATTKIKQKDLIKIYENVIIYIEKLKVTKSLKKEINNISPLYLLLTSPIIFLFALYRRPKLKKLLFNNYFFFIKNWKITKKYKWDTLIHRDLRASILLSKKFVHVIDWQLASISNDLLEFAQLFVTYFENKKMGIEFKKFERINKLTDEENKLFKLIIIYVLFTEIGFVKTKKFTDEKLLLEKLLKS